MGAAAPPQLTQMQLEMFWASKSCITRIEAASMAANSCGWGMPRRP
jgi:hypothetical protein